MVDKARSIMGTLGVFNSLWTPIGILVIVLFAFWNMQGSIDAIDKKQNNNTEVITQQLELLREISRSLYDKERDHQEFAKRQEETKNFMLSTVRVLDRLTFTLDSIDKKLKTP